MYFTDRSVKYSGSLISQDVQVISAFNLGKAHKSIFSRITVFGRLGGRGFRFGRYEKSEKIDFSWSGQIQTLSQGRTLKGP